jgi:hypothetical protein
MANQPDVPAYRDLDHAPVVYFDIVAAHGVLNGIIELELASRALTPTSDGKVRVSFATACRVRCSPAAAGFLRDALQKTIEMFEHPEPGLSVAGGRAN